MIKSKETIISIPAPRIKVMKIKIKGTAPLIFNRWSEKATRMILDKQLKKAKQPREVRNPKEEYENSYYKNKDGKISIPALWIKQALVGSARFVEGLPMTILRGTIFIEGDNDGLIPIRYREERMRQDMVRIGMGVADLRFRGEVKDWSCEFILKFNEGILSAEQVLNLLQIAGFSSGLGEWRPERNGVFGTFEIEQ